MLQHERTIISQYANSPAIKLLIEGWNQAVDPSGNIDSFYSLVWNVATAVGYGLDVWGRIVGVQRVLTIGASKFFGFEEATSVSADPFNQAPYYSGQPSTENFALSDEAFRLLILAKAAANIGEASTPFINALLMFLFPLRGNVYVIDHGNMTMTINFTFSLTPVEVSIVNNSGVLPIPAGVSVNVVIP